MTCLQTDHTLKVGNQAFVDIENDKGHKFELKPICILGNGGSLKLNGSNIHLNQNIYSINQEFHLNYVHELCSSLSIAKSGFITQRERGA